MLEPTGDQIEALMAPDHRTFELRELIAHHAWPDVDVRAIQMDEI